MDKSVIIALTFDQRDEIHLASTEKIPHCTMIYMTSPSSPEEAQAVSEHVAEVARINQPLYINVTGRGTLGPDEADVLFLDRKNESLQELRYHLLSDPTIRRLRDGAAQYDEWTPHVTLGYPTSPSKVKTFKSYSLMGVALEVWFGEFEGPKYVLNNDLMESLEVQMSGTDRLGALLEHHGIKGMKWGIRRSDKELGNKPTKSSQDRHERIKTILGNEISSPSSKNSSSGSYSNEPTESSQDRYESLKKAIKKKGAKSLSDQDLQFVNQRTNAIKQATKATERKKSTTEKILRDVGESTAKKVLKDVAENYATKIVTNTLIGKNRGNSLKTILENASGVTDEMRENKKAQKALKDTQSAIAKAVEKTRTESVAKHRSAWPGPSKAQGYGDAGKRKLKRDRKITSSSVERILNIAIGGGK